MFTDLMDLRIATPRVAYPLRASVILFLNSIAVQKHEHIHVKSKFRGEDQKGGAVLLASRLRHSASMDNAIAANRISRAGAV